MRHLAVGQASAFQRPLVGIRSQATLNSTAAELSLLVDVWDGRQKGVKSDSHGCPASQA